MAYTHSYSGGVKDKGLGNSLGYFFGKARGFNPSLLLGEFGDAFRKGAGIPDGTPLWSKGTGLQIGKLPIQKWKDIYSINPDAIGLDATKNYGGLGDIYQNLTGPDSVLNGTKRIDLRNAIESGDLTALGDNAQAKIDAATRLKDLNLDKVADGIEEAPKGAVSLGDIANVGSLAIQGVKGFQNFNDLVAAQGDASSIKDDIARSAMANPMYASYLNASDKAMLRKIQNGTYDSKATGKDIGNGVEGALKSLPQALLAALGGYATGGIVGAGINGIGTLANSGIEAAADKRNTANANLQALYERLSDAEDQYNQMRRPTNLRGAGLSNRYMRDLY